MSETPEPVVLAQGDPAAAAVTSAIRRGDVEALRGLLDGRPELARVRMLGTGRGWRTPLHVATDWPGYLPAAPASAALLLAAGADPNDNGGGAPPGDPLHWAASTDDVDVAAVLVDGGAELDTPGGSIGTPLDNAVGYGCWHVARLLVERGARVDSLWHAAALGMLERLEQLMDGRTPAEVSQAFWHACSGGQRRAADYLLARGADLAWVPPYAAGTPLDAVLDPDTRRSTLATWLRDQGAAPA